MENKKSINTTNLIRKFLLINFGLTFLFGIGVYLDTSRGGTAGAFAALQMYFPALAVILTLMTSGLDLSKTTRRTYIIYIIGSVVFGLGAIFSIFNKEVDLTNGIIIGTSLMFLIVLLTEKKEKRRTANLRIVSLKKSIPVVLLFLVLYFLRPGILSLISGEMDSFLVAFRPEKITYFFLALVSFPLSFLPFLGEEYGWRYFLQPLLQEKYGMRKGLIYLGIIWGLWHLPLNMFYYSADGSQIQSLVNQIFICLAYGIFFGYAYTKTGSVWTVTLIHYLNNNLILMFTDVMDPSVIENQAITWPQVLASGLISLILFGAFIFSKYNSDRKFLEKNPVERFEIEEMETNNEEK